MSTNGTCSKLYAVGDSGARRVAANRRQHLGSYLSASPGRRRGRGDSELRHPRWGFGVECRCSTAVCTENSVLIDYVAESPNVSAMIALLCFLLILS
jgi:hypothetical protein